MSRKLLVVVVLGGLVAWTAAPLRPSVADIRQALSKSVPLLQVSGQKFMDRTPQHCISCHHNILTAMVEEQCRVKQVAFTDTFRKARVYAALGGLQFVCNPNLQVNFIAAKFIPAYALLALKADQYPPDRHTDIPVDYLLDIQKPDGTFGAEFGRPPLEGGEAHLAALCIYAIENFASPVKTLRVEKAVRRTREWLVAYQTDIPQEQVFQLLGLHWCGATPVEMEPMVKRLLSCQHADGSWSQLSTMHGDAYATGQALYALAESGVVKTSDECYQRGLAWLLRTQDLTGAWIVETRAYPIQPFIDSDFPPYDENQFISAAATNWASLALLEALPR